MPFVPSYNEGIRQFSLAMEHIFDTQYGKGTSERGDNACHPRIMHFTALFKCNLPLLIEHVLINIDEKCMFCIYQCYVNYQRYCKLNNTLLRHEIHYSMWATHFGITIRNNMTHTLEVESPKGISCDLHRIVQYNFSHFSRLYVSFLNPVCSKELFWNNLCSGFYEKSIIGISKAIR